MIFKVKSYPKRSDSLTESSFFCSKMSSSTQTSSLQSKTQPNPPCHCGLPCKEWTSTKEASKGKKFYKCLHWGKPDDCKFFGWVEDFHHDSIDVVHLQESFKVKMKAMEEKLLSVEENLLDVKEKLMCMEDQLSNFNGSIIMYLRIVICVLIIHLFI
ncbi:hypothetical protein QJS04_geneDACA000998 [Acorus gramineus]|uniref:GRF-type domain-containing protein n=1 Tax=Acorus gramineus TaxID=55184 RepID=A0AAV9ACV0_ACOGR|nr:hypothetical protein QJS04_geneDACA000998 [Acorus gramineus]